MNRKSKPVCPNTQARKKVAPTQSGAKKLKKLIAVLQEENMRLKQALNANQRITSLAAEKQRKNHQDKLVAHGLISGKSKILTKCDGCSENGRCLFQKFTSVEPWLFCLGPFPIDVDDQIRFDTFPLDQVNYWENTDLYN